MSGILEAHGEAVKRRTEAPLQFSARSHREMPPPLTDCYRFACYSNAMQTFMRHAHGIRFTARRDNKASRESRGLLLAIMLAAAIALALLSEATPSAAAALIGA